MIVKCEQLYNMYTKEYYKYDPAGDLHIGYHYMVLDIRFKETGIDYRIISDAYGLIMSSSFLELANNFSIISNKIPENWILNRELSQLVPYKWSDFSLWEESFWQDFSENRAKALQCYRDEIKKIAATDKDYIKTMIDERRSDDMLDWRKTMIPLFNEVLQGYE